MRCNMSVLQKPIITEKALRLNEKRQYVFDVGIDANKIEIRKAVEKQFEVKIESVRIVRSKAKRKVQLTRKGRFSGKTSAQKKAYVTVKEGYSIDMGTNSAE